MPKNKTWIITTSGQRSTKDVAKDLKAKGFTVDQVLDEIGTIIGAGDDAVADKVRKIDGVSDVSPDSPVDIGPPDAPTTW
jgi:hypothetical protein